MYRIALWAVLSGFVLACSGVGTPTSSGPLFPVKAGKAGLLATYAYVHEDGSAGVPGVFLYAERPGTEPAWVKTGTGWGVLAADGSYLVEPTLDLSSTQPFRNGVAVVEKNRDQGLIRTDGTYLVELGKHSVGPASDTHWTVHSLDSCFYIDSGGAKLEGFLGCRGGDALLSVRVENGWTFVGVDGTLADGRYDEAQGYSDDRAWVLVDVKVRRGQPVGQWVLLDVGGAELARLPPGHEPKGFTGGQAHVSGPDGVYFVDKAGQTVHGPYDNAGPLAEGLVYVRKGNQGQVVDTKGGVVYEVAGAAPKLGFDAQRELYSFAHGAAWLPNGPKSFTAYDRDGKRLLDGVSRPTAFDAEGWGSGIVDGQTVWVNADGRTVEASQ